jgi:hypothetical protein
VADAAASAQAAQACQQRREAAVAAERRRRVDPARPDGADLDVVVERSQAGRGQATADRGRRETERREQPRERLHVDREELIAFPFRSSFVGGSIAQPAPAAAASNT